MKTGSVLLLLSLGLLAFSSVNAAKPRSQFTRFRSWNTRMYPVWRDGDPRFRNCWNGGEVSFDLKNDAPTLTGAKASFNINLNFPTNQTVLADGQVVWSQNCTVDGQQYQAGQPVYPDSPGTGVFPDGTPFRAQRRPQRYVYVWKTLGKYWQVADGPSSSVSIDTADVPLGSYTMELIIYHLRGQSRFIPLGYASSVFTITNQVPFTISMSQVNDLNEADQSFIQNRAIAFSVHLHDPSQYLNNADISFTWDFGDSSGTLISRDSTVTHTYLSVGAFKPLVTLMASIPTCGTPTAAFPVEASAAPAVVVVSPAAVPEPAEPAEGATVAPALDTAVVPDATGETDAEAEEDTAATDAAAEDATAVDTTVDAAAADTTVDATAVDTTIDAAAEPAAEDATAVDTTVDAAAEPAAEDATAADTTAAEGTIDAAVETADATEDTTATDAATDAATEEAAAEDATAADATVDTAVVADATATETEATEAATEPAADTTEEATADTTEEAAPADTEADATADVAATDVETEAAADATVEAAADATVEAAADEATDAVDAEAGVEEAEVAADDNTVAAVATEAPAAAEAAPAEEEEAEAVETVAEPTVAAAEQPAEAEAEVPLVIAKRQAPELTADDCTVYRYGSIATSVDVVQGIESVEIVQVSNVVSMATELEQNAVDVTISCQGSLPSEVCTVISDADCINPVQTVCGVAVPTPDCQMVLRQFFNDTGVFCLNVSLTNDVSLAVASARVNVNLATTGSPAGTAATVFGVMVLACVVCCIGLMYRRLKQYQPLVEEGEAGTSRTSITAVPLLLWNLLSRQSPGESRPLLQGRIV